MIIYVRELLVRLLALCRVRHGYAHVVNNLYNGWKDYAIGGSMGPSVKSQGNLFMAGGPGDNKKVSPNFSFQFRI